MKRHLSLLLTLLCLTTAGLGEEKNGLRLTAQKTTLERDKDRDGSSYWDRVEKALGLKVSAKNVSMKEMPEGTIDSTVIVKRWGYSPPKIERYSSTEKLPPLKPGAEANVVSGKVAIGGYERGGDKRYQDSIEAWQVIVKHNGTETCKITSTGTFEKLNARAKDGPKQP